MARVAKRKPSIPRKHSDSTMVRDGIVAPAFLCLWFLAELALGFAVWPSIGHYRFSFRLVSQPFPFWMAELVKLGIAAGLIGRFYVPNHATLYRWSQPVSVLGFVAAIGAFIAGGLSFLY